MKKHLLISLLASFLLIGNLSYVHAEDEISLDIPEFEELDIVENPDSILEDFDNNINEVKEVATEESNKNEEALEKVIDEIFDIKAEDKPDSSLSQKDKVPDNSNKEIELLKIEEKVIEQVPNLEENINFQTEVKDNSVEIQSTDILEKEDKLQLIEEIKDIKVLKEKDILIPPSEKNEMNYTAEATNKIKDKKKNPSVTFPSSIPESMKKKQDKTFTPKTSYYNLVTNKPSIKKAFTDLDAIRNIEPINQKVTSTKIDIDKGNFNNPFSNSSNDLNQEFINSPALSSQNEEDFIDTGDLLELRGDDSTIQDIATLRKIPKKEFYLKESHLDIEISKANNPYEKYIIANEALKMGQYESAIMYYKNILKSNAKDKEALFGIATSYHLSKQYQQAKDAYLKLIKFNPKNKDAISNYIALIASENPTESILKLQELFQENTNQHLVAAHIANLYFKKSNYSKAVEYYSYALEVDPLNINYKYNLAVILDKAEQYGQAALLYKSILKDASEGKKIPEDINVIKNRFYEIISKRG